MCILRHMHIGSVLRYSLLPKSETCLLLSLGVGIDRGARERLRFYRVMTDAEAMWQQHAIILT